MVDFDPTTGEKGKTLRALASYRRRNGRIVFGIFLRAMGLERHGNENKMRHKPNNTDDDNPDNLSQNDIAWIHEGDILECK